jgi:argininosuccinate lyase
MAETKKVEKTQLWAKGELLDKQIHSFTVGDDHLIDLNLVPHDCLGSAAHAIMLSEVGLLSEEQQGSILCSLKEIYARATSGKFIILPEQEDCHTAIEAALTEAVGEAGKRIHVGRSRNDQVLLTVRLFLRHETISLLKQLSEVAQCLSERSLDLMDVPMPGYTHLQRAMPSSVGMFLHAFLEHSLDLIRSGLANLDLLDRSPLGAGAGFGVSLPLDRERVASLLGFREVQRSPIDVQNSRGREELRALRLISDIGMMVEKISWDLQLGNMEESSFFKLPNEFTTGSSIMPQKRNPDVLELLRAKAGVLRGAEDELRWITAKMPSNYHRDFQLTKPPLVRALNCVKECLSVLSAVVKGFEVNEEALAAAMTPELYATYDAFRSVKAGMPFRDAYRETAARTAAGELDVESLKIDWKIVRDSQLKYLEQANGELDSLRKVVLAEEERLKSISTELLGDKAES